MSSKIIIVAVAVIGVGAVVSYWLYTPTVEAPADVEVVATEEEEETSSEERFSGIGSLQNLWREGASSYCTFSSTVSGVRSEGKSWFADGKFAVESVSQVDGELYSMNMINDGTRTYTWSGTVAGGMAMVMDNVDSNTMDADMTMTDAAPSSQFDMSTDVSYECAPWNVELLKFVPPSGMTFTDYDDIMNGAFEGVMRGQPEGMDFSDAESLQVDVERR